MGTQFITWIKEKANLEVLDQCISDLDKVEGGGSGTVFIDIVPDGVRCVGNFFIGGK